MVSRLLLTLFQSNSRAKEFFIRAPLVATGSISSAAVQTNLSIRGSECTTYCWGSTLLALCYYHTFVQFHVYTHMCGDSLLPAY